MNKFNDDMYYYIYKDLVYPTSDEVMYEVRMRGYDVSDALYSIKEVRGSLLNEIPQTAYNQEYWGDLVEKYNQVHTVSKNTDNSDLIDKYCREDEC